MSDVNTATDTATETPEVDGGTDEGAITAEHGSADLDPKVSALIAKKNSEAANLRKRLKELEPLAAKAREQEEAQKSELQRLTEKHEAALVELTAANHALLRERVARQKSLPDELAELLQGDDEKEMAAHADRLAALISKPDRRPDPSQGAGSSDMPLNGDPIENLLREKLGIA